MQYMSHGIGLTFIRMIPYVIVPCPEAVHRLDIISFFKPALDSFLGAPVYNDAAGFEIVILAVARRRLEGSESQFGDFGFCLPGWVEIVEILCSFFHVVSIAAAYDRDSFTFSHCQSQSYNNNKYRGKLQNQ
jgi:hypothetical protein